MLNWVFNSTFPRSKDVLTQLMQNQHEFIRRLPSLFIPITCIVEFVVPDIQVTDTELEQKQMGLLYSHNYTLSIMYTHSHGYSISNEIGNNSHNLYNNYTQTMSKSIS
jgi:hypothetical protein